LLRCAEHGVGGPDLRLGWLDDGVALAAGEYVPGGAEVDRVVAGCVTGQAGQVVDLLLSTLDVLGDRGEARE